MSPLLRAAEFEDLYPDVAYSADDLIGRIQEWPATELAQLLGRVNILLPDGYSSSSGTLEESVTQVVFPVEDRARLEQFIAAWPEAKILNREALRALLMLVIAEDAQGSDSDVDARGDSTPARFERMLRSIGPMVLLTMSVMDWSSKTAPPDQKAQALLADLYSASFLQSTDALGGPLARYRAIYHDGLAAVREKYPKEALDLHAAFRAAFSCGLEEAQATCYLLWSYYLSRHDEDIGSERDFAIPLEYFGRLPEPGRRAVQRALPYVSRPWMEQVAAVRRFRSKWPRITSFANPIYSHPLVQAPKAYFALDMHYIMSRATEGVYWGVFDHLRDAAERNRLNTAVGHAVEWYARELLRTTFAHHEPKRIWFDWDGEIAVAGRSQTRPDIVVADGSTLFFIEVTTVATPPAVATGGQWSAIRSALEGLWFGTEERTGKLRQLARAIDGFRHGRISVPGLAANNWNIVPVLVGLRALPQTADLVQEYRGMAQAAGLDSSFASSWVYVDLSELEWLAWIAARGTSWVEIFQASQQYSGPLRAMRDYLHHAGYDWEWHPVAERYRDLTFRRNDEILFGTMSDDPS